MNEIQTLQAWVNEASRISFFGGAGVSTESGIPDYRSVDGLYNQKFKYPPETYLSHSFFLAKPEEFYEFYRAKMLPQGVKPNAAHYKLAEMEEKGKLTGVVTQNIDGLHQAAGSKKVFELHGSVHRNKCMKCGAMYDESVILGCDGVPHCACGGIIKPDVVLYEEPLNGLLIEEASDAIMFSDLLIIGGTSLTVYPAASLIRYFRGNRIVLINKEETKADSLAGLVIHAPIGEVLSQITI